MRTGEDGFTLIELLITVSILAAVAFVVAGNYAGVGGHANDQLVRSEMQEIAQAIRQFRQDTGYYPKTGPFGMDDDGITGAIDYADLPDLAGSDDATRKAWFYSPANFWMLTVRDSPLAGTDHQLREWDAESGRGWRGPYLEGFDDGYVNISDELNDGSAAGDSAGSPVETVSASEISDVPGLADPFEYRPDSGSGYLAWRADVGGKARDYWGRPYLLFGLDGSDVIVGPGADGSYDGSDEVVAGPVLMSCGPDGKYHHISSDGTDDDIILEIE